MVALEAPDGTPYCIDRTEVTQADYALFLKQTTAVPGSEDPRCQYNTSYAGPDARRTAKTSILAHWMLRSMRRYPMDVQLQLTREEARLLGAHLDRYLAHLDAELVRTDKHELQKALAADILALRVISDRLDASAPSVRRPVVHG